MSCRMWIPLVAMCTYILPHACWAAQPDSSDDVIASVNSRELFRSDLQLDFFLRQLEQSPAKMTQQQLIDRLVDRELIRQFLNRRKVEADPTLLKQQMTAIRDLVTRRGDDLTAVLAKLGLSEESLQEMLSLQIAWRMHVTQTLTESTIQKHWSEQNWKYDGSTVTASQIFKRLSPDAMPAEVEAVKQELIQLKNRIERGAISFAEAARQHSDSPSAARGGDLGSFEYYGAVAEPIAEAAFALNVGEVSSPFQSPYGWHLVQLREKLPGDLSLEDARPLVVKTLSDQMWQTQVERERQSARIQILSPIDH